MFFEASRIGCLKTTYYEKKVTYNMYTCYICCISREMMGTDGRDRATCQNLEEGTYMAFLELFNDNRTK